MCGGMGLLTDSTVPRLRELVYHSIGNLAEQWGPQGVWNGEVGGLQSCCTKGVSGPSQFPEQCCKRFHGTGDVLEVRKTLQRAAMIQGREQACSEL